MSSLPPPPHPLPDPPRQPTEPQPPHPTPVPAEPATGRGQGLAIASLVLGVPAAAGALLPVVNYVSWSAGATGLVLGLVALARKPRQRGIALSGVIVSGVGFVLSIVLASIYTIGWVRAVNDLRALGDSRSRYASSTPTPRPPLPKAPSKTVEVVLEVSGTAPEVTVSYRTDSGDRSISENITPETLPWSKTTSVPVDEADGYAYASVTAVSGRGGGDFACRVIVDGEVVSERQASGEWSYVRCDADLSNRDDAVAD